MRNAYIVLEGEENAPALRQIFLTDQWKDVEILGAKYRSTAISIAGTLMSDRSRPVLLLIDAKSTKLEDIREETNTIEYLLL